MLLIPILNLGKEILDNFTEYLPKFKKIIPIDYEKMLTTILQMEEQGMSSEQAKQKHFMRLKRRKIGGKNVGKVTGFMEYERQDKPAEDHQKSELSILKNSTHLCQKKNRSAKVPDVWRAAFRSASPDR